MYLRTCALHIVDTRCIETLLHIGVGKIAVNVDEMNIDMLSLSGHKIYGPKVRYPVPAANIYRRNAY